jgi:hypothetical protein
MHGTILTEAEGRSGSIPVPPTTTAFRRVIGFLFFHITAQVCPEQSRRGGLHVHTNWEAGAVSVLCVLASASAHAASEFEAAWRQRLVDGYLQSLKEMAW